MALWRRLDFDNKFPLPVLGRLTSFDILERYCKGALEMLRATKVNLRGLIRLDDLQAELTS